METIKLIRYSKVGNKRIRVIHIDQYVNEPYEDYVCSAYQVQVRKRFLFITFWSIIKTYFYNAESNNGKGTGVIQKHNALKFFRKLVIEASNG